MLVDEAGVWEADDPPLLPTGVVVVGTCALEVVEAAASAEEAED